MLVEADERSPLETGGVVLGVADGVNVWIEAFVGPGPNAHHTRTTFVPDAEYQDRRIAEIYEAFDRRISYLGDWHTHPTASPQLSWRDRRTLRVISREAKARQTRPLMLIFGEGPSWNAIAWRYLGRRWRIFGTGCTAMRLVVTWPVQTASKWGLRKPLDDRAVFTQPRQCDPLVTGKGEKPSTTMNSLIESGFDLRNPVMSGCASFRNEKMISRC